MFPKTDLTRVVTLIAFFTLGWTVAYPNHVAGQDVTITIEKSPPGSEDKPKVEGKEPFSGDRPGVDVAILLDTSNSMDGLINQAKSQLWTMVQKFADAKKRGKTPLLRVSVFEYGNSNLPASEGYVRQVAQLTDDLDEVSEALFGLRTDGGDEYCGTVISEAIKRLDWNDEPNAYKAIFIAGNEPFTQGPVEYQKACKQAIESGIVVNTIHCGNYQKGVEGKWQHGAELAEGEYLNIDQDEKVVHIQTPQDKIIIEFNNELNKTYLWFGSQPKRKAFETNQIQQDANASSFGSISTRAQTKAGAVYSNRGRDLVDSYSSNLDALAKVPVAELPESMQSMSPEQRKAHVVAMKKRREEIQKKIAELSRLRADYVKAERAKAPAPAAAATFGDAFAEAVEEQLQASGFEVK